MRGSIKLFCVSTSLHNKSLCFLCLLFILCDLCNTETRSYQIIVSYWQPVPLPVLYCIYRKSEQTHIIG
ncbi:unnamed protein product [Leptidea sinapis]|uniref:G-protein coupled receptors family 1 profile domain-containing protein n=1 Tax=Leptidea sinapis TaxID=189913 RepID=A0A5E4PLH8_9NEOP|nr:unnamed protein product [Leptidea sinapis]